MKPARHHFFRGVVTYALLFAVVVATTLTLSQCTMVGDNVTGVRLTTTQINQCQQDCTQAAVDKLAAEAKRHAEEIQRCAQLSGDDRYSCIQAENDLLAANLKAILDAWRACKNGCHTQGSGNAG
jgi:hypothetical protein